MGRVYDSGSVYGTRVYRTLLCLSVRSNMAKDSKKKRAKMSVKKRPKVIEEKPEVAYDDDDDEEVDSTSEEEEQEDGGDERRRQKLLEAISSLGGERETQVAFIDQKSIMRL